MSIGAGFTLEEIREVVYEYQLQPHGQKTSWLSARGVGYDQLRRWRAAVYEGDLYRGLIPREGSPMTIPPNHRTALERQRARERAAHDAEVAGLKTRVKELEEANAALGKAIGLLHQMNVQEPDAIPPTSDPHGS
jgi:hypothetical protein